MSTHRREHITTNIRRAVQEVLARGLGDPRLRGLLSVTNVQISTDGREAVVSVSVYPEQYEARSMQGLIAGTMKIQRMVNNRVPMGRPPHLRFVLDRSLKKQADLLEAIREAVEPVGQETQSPEPPVDDAPADLRTETNHAGKN